MSKHNKKVPGISNATEGKVGEVVRELKSNSSPETSEQNNGETIVVDTRELFESSINKGANKANGIPNAVATFFNAAAIKADTGEYPEVSNEELEEIEEEKKRQTGENEKVTDNSINPRIKEKKRKTGVFPVVNEKHQATASQSGEYSLKPKRKEVVGSTDKFKIVTSRSTGEHEITEADPADSGSSYSIQKPRAGKSGTFAKMRLKKRPSNEQEAIGEAEKNENISRERKKWFFNKLIIQGLLEQVEKKIKINGRHKTTKRNPFLDELKFDISSTAEGHVHKMSLGCPESKASYIYTNNEQGVFITKIKDGKFLKRVKIG